MPMPSDADLVQSVQSGDEKAFETLVAKYRIRIYTAISAFIDNPQDREDIAQETFINAYRNLHQLSKPERLGSWLDRIAQNQCRDWMRKNRVQTVPIDEVEENLPNSDDSPEQSSVEAERRRIIAQAIEALPQAERQIARAHYLEDASHDELVSRHDISYQSVSGRLFRAKRRLAKRLRHLLGGVLVPPSTTLKNISSGGFTAMKIGTASKITVGAIAVVALVFIVLHQLKSPEENLPLSDKIVQSMPNESIRPVEQTDDARESTVTSSLTEDEPQISAEEMEQVEDFFAQLETDDAQSDTKQLAEAEFRQDADESVAGNTDVFTENTEQSAEEVMNAFLKAFRIYDRGAMRSLLTADMRERSDFPAPMRVSVETTEVRVEERDGTEGVEHPDRVEEKEEENRQLEQLMLESVLKTISQAEVVDSEYVGDEFHFKLGVPALATPGEVPGIDSKITLPPYIPTYIPIPDVLIKMRKEADAWRIYDNETLD